MSNLHLKLLGSLLAVALFVAAGCGKPARSIAPVSIEQVPQVLENAFKTAPAEVGTAAAEAVSAVQTDEPIVALENLQDLAARSDISQEQHAATSQAMAAYLQKLRENADKGNKKAEDALEHYRATK